MRHDSRRRDGGRAARRKRRGDVQIRRGRVAVKGLRNEVRERVPAGLPVLAEQSIEENAVAGPKHHTVTSEQPVGEADARGKVMLAEVVGIAGSEIPGRDVLCKGGEGRVVCRAARIDQAADVAADARVAGEQDRPGGGLETHQAIVRADQWRLQIVANAKVKCEPAGDFPVVLHIRGESPAEQRIARVAQRAAGLARIAKQQVGHGVTAVLTREGVGAKPAAIVEPHGGVVIRIATELEGMSTLVPRNASDELVRGVHAIARQIGLSDGIEAGDDDCRDAARFFIQVRGGALNAPDLRVVVMRNVRADLLKAVVADGDVANQVRREDMRVGDGGALPALVIVASVEGKVGDAAEDVEGIKLEIIVERIAAEKAVAVRQLVVDTRRELVDVANVGRRRHIVANGAAREVRGGILLNNFG